MESKLNQILVCPICKGPLFWNDKKKEFYCRADMKAYAVIDDIPDMVPEDSRDITEEELEEIEK